MNQAPHDSTPPRSPQQEPLQSTLDPALYDSIDASDPDLSHPADLAEHLENLHPDEQLRMLRTLSAEEAAETLAELDEDMAGDMLEQMHLHEAAHIVTQMSPDDAADVLDELEQDHLDALLGSMPREDADELRRLMAFDPETAAGIMNTEVIVLEQNQTVDEAILHIRREMEDKELPYYAYVVDDHDKLMGVCSLRDLMLSRPGVHLRDTITDQDVVSVAFDTDREEVARIMSHYNYAALPVVDHEHRLLGIVTYDDILDIIQDEASSDLLGMVGAGQDESVDTLWYESVGMRLPWLVVNMLTSALSAFVVYLFEGSIAQMSILAVLMPMVANQAGNTGQQALAVMIRQLATERFDQKRAWVAVFREGKIGIATGIIMALLVFGGVYAFTGTLALSFVMAGALLSDMVLGALAGGAIPLFFRWLGRDPAQASSIFLTAITDSAGFFIFLGLATAFLL